MLLQLGIGATEWLSGFAGASLLRTRKDRSLKTVSDAGHGYGKLGAYTACVKAVEVFGADTSITVEVEV